MKDNLENIEDLFRESFDGFESDVNPDVWNNISQQIGSQVPSQDPSSSVSSSAGSSSGMAGIGAVKVAAIIGAAGILSIGGYFLLSEDDSAPVESPNTTKTEILVDQKEEILSEDTKEITENITVAPQSTNEDNGNNNIQEPVDNKQDETSVTSTKPELNPSQETLDADKPSENATAKENNKGNVVIVSPTDAPEIKTDEKEEISPEEEIEQMEIFEASIYASISKGKQPLEVRFENRGTYSNDVHWKFNDGEESNSNSEYHTFEKSGDFWVILEIRNSDGKISKDSTKISVQGKAYINAPNTFSPNGDGINDAFMVESDYVQSFNCKVFDRNQRMIVEWNSVYGHWDGRDMRNNLVAPGTYFYIIESTDMDGNQLELIKGTVTLFR